MKWFPSTARVLSVLGYGPDRVGSAQAVAAFAEAGRIGGRVVPMRARFAGHIAPGSLPVTGLGGGRVTGSEPRGFPSTVAPDGRPVGGSSTQDLLWRTSGLQGTNQ